jgi:hypothetical protein
MSRSENEERFKSSISGAKGVHWRSDRHGRSGRRDYQREIAKVFGSFFTNAGLDVRKLDEILVQERDEIRRNFREEVANAAKRYSSAQAIFRHDVEARRTALAMLAQPYLSNFITLDMPSEISEFPGATSRVVATHFESFNNWIKIKVAEDGGTDTRSFFFSFPWTNDSPYFAVVNILCFLVLNGNCEVDARGGFFNADTVKLHLSTRLDVIRESGWGSDPLTGDGTSAVFDNSQQFDALEVSGHTSIFHGGSEGTNSEVFQFKEIDHTFDFLLVPGGAQITVRIALDVHWEISSDNISNLASANFADNDLGDDLRVSCPFVQLELLTAPQLA